MGNLVAILAEDKELINYRPRLNKISGGVLSSILLQQILYWWFKSKRQPFYKFSGPCSHKLYRAGDSWQEELGFSRSEFETALGKFATKINRKDSKTDALQTSLVVYWTGFDRLTWYEVNESLLEAKIEELYKADVMQESRNAGILHYDARNAEMSHYLMQDSSISYCGNPALDRSETTSENNSENLHASTPAPRKRKAANNASEGEKESHKLTAAGTPTPPVAPAPSSPHQAIMRAYADALGYPIRSYGKEANAAKWLVENHYTPDQVVACYQSMKADSFWRDKHLSLQTLSDKIGAWVQSHRPTRQPVQPTTLPRRVPRNADEYAALTLEERAVLKQEHFRQEWFEALTPQQRREVRFGIRHTTTAHA